MARTYAKLKGSIWRDEDWRQLPASHQRLYLLLFSQPEITNCGVLPYLPGKWARMAADTTLDDVETIISHLQQARFVCVDEETCELLIRTYVKHDQVEEQPKIKAAAQRQYETLHSPRIRTALAAEYPDTFGLNKGEEPYPEPYAIAYREGYAEPSEIEGYREGYPVPTRVRARAATGYRTPVPATHQPPAAPAANGTATTPAAAAIERLRTAGWSDSQLTTADLGDPHRAEAWLEHFQLDPTAKKPGALAWQKFSTTDQWPETPRTEIAPGAVGTRSTSPPLPDRPAEPEPEPAPPPPDFLALAGHTSEPPPPPPPSPGDAA